MGNIKFGTSTPTKKAQPTVADALASGQFFTTGFGTLYIKAQGGQIVKLGNSLKPSRNQVVVKPANYFDGRQNEAVTLHGEELNVAV